MAYEIFRHAPGKGDYGSDWERVACVRAERMAYVIAHRLSQTAAIRIMKGPRRGISRLIATIQPYAGAAR